MTGVGRNDLCPCGSGRKFKKCCLGKTDGSAVAFTRDECAAAWERLARFSERQEFTESRMIAEEVFWGEWLDQRAPDDVVRAMKLEESRTAFGEWFTLDYRLPGGATLVELLLEREANRLRAGEGCYLERMRLSHVRPYEVTRVLLDEGLDLRDLWTREVIQIEERRATHQLVQGNRTPREAATLKSVRPKLVSLLKEMEVRAERDRREGRPAYDFAWMWAELGLERPE